MIRPETDPEVVRQLREKYNCTIWHDREGILIPLRIMEAGHLQNCYRMVQHELEDTQYAYQTIDDPNWGPDPDSMAYYCATGEADHWYEEEYPRMLAVLAEMEQIMKERGIEIPTDWKPVQKLPTPTKVEYVQVGDLSAKIIHLGKGDNSE